MKFLIIDDETEIREIIEMQITSLYEVQIFQAENGLAALKEIEENGPFDLIMSDYTMPVMNGGELYLKLRETNKKTPFVLCSGDSSKFRLIVKQPHLVFHLSKPIEDDALSSTLEKALSSQELTKQSESHLPVAIETLFKTQTNGVSIYLKLNDSQYIKVLKESAVFDQSELQRFQMKKLSHLYIELIDFKIFLNIYRKNVFAKVQWDEINPEDGLDVLKADWSLIVEGQKHFGWSESIMELTKQNIARTISLIKKNDHFRKMFDKMLGREKKTFLIPHGYMLVAMCTQILDQLQWGTASTLQKISFASLLHDMDLNEVMFKNKLSMLSEGKFHEDIRDQLNYQLFNHGNRIAESIQRWTSCPADVDKIISQHHEKFDGTGFPHRLNFQTIFPLAAVFIIAEDLIYKKINFPETVLKDYLESKRNEYFRGDLKNIFEAALNCL